MPRPTPDSPRDAVTLAAPLPWVEMVSQLSFPPRVDGLITELVDRNNEGLLTADERAELESLAAFVETLSIVRADARHLLGR